VADLKKAFPKIQFAATTHSPFIVQSMDAGSLINLDKNELSISPDELPLNKVATEVMGVKNIRSDDFERRYEQARGELISMKKAKGDLTMDDYRKISESLSRIVTNETNDPINKAFLEAKGK
jgi:predicted ATP-binding protein involved in virulence